MDRTVKIPAFSGEIKPGASQDNLSKDQKLALELASKNALLEEEKARSRDQVNVIEHLRESIKQEQAKSAALAMKAADLEAKLDDLHGILDKISHIASARKGN